MNLKAFAGLLFLVSSMAYATLAPQDPDHAKKTSTDASSSSSAFLTKAELAVKEDEQDRIFLLGLKIMENFGCSDYTELGLKALIEFLRGQEGFENKTRTRVVFTAQEHARNLTGHFSLLNYTEKTDTPESKIRSSSKGYSEAFRALSKILNEDLYRSYGDKTDLKKIADDLDNPRSQYGTFFKKRIRDALNLLNSYSSVDHFNVGCRVQGVPADRKKNKLQITVKDSSGNLEKVHLDEYMKRPRKKKSEVVDTTVRKETAAPAPKTDKPVTAPVAPKKENPSPRSVAPSTKPAPKTTPAPTPQKPHASPAPNPVTKPNGNDSASLVVKYLSIPQASLGSYLEKGWRTEYEDFIGALIVEENPGLLRNFYKFAPVCSKLNTFTTNAQKIWFLKKFFKALAKVESGFNPRNETRESLSTKYRSKSKSLPADVRGLAFIDHSCGMFQLSEEAALSSLDMCKGMDYANDVRIGYPSSRELLLRDKRSGVYNEYNGDVRRTILNPFRNTACALDIMESLLNKGSLYSSSQHWAGLRTQSSFSGSRSRLKAAIQAEIPGC